MSVHIGRKETSCEDRSRNKSDMRSLTNEEARKHLADLVGIASITIISEYSIQCVVSTQTF